MTIKRIKVPSEPLTDAEFQVVLAAAKTHSPRLYAMVLIARNHGLRGEELCSLRAEHISGRYLTLLRDKDSETGLHELSDAEIEALQPFLGRPGTLFGIHRPRFWQLFREITEACNLPPAKQSPHSLRHTCVKAAVLAGVPLPAIQTFVGHKSLASTGRYAKYSQAEACAAMRAAMAQQPAAPSQAQPSTPATSPAPAPSYIDPRFGFKVGG